MKNRFKLRQLPIFFAGILLVFISLQTTLAQNPASKPSLTLAEVLTGLQAKSGGFSMAEKNDFLSKTVLQRGITFRLSPDIESELLRAGANTGLMSAIRTKAPRISKFRNTNNPNASVKYDDLLVDYNVVEKGKKGMRVHVKFGVNNLQDVPLYLSLNFITEKGKAINTPAGKRLIVKRNFQPKYASSFFKDADIFVAYDLIGLPAGKHSLKIDADLYYRDGNEMLKHLDVHRFTFTQPTKTRPLPKLPKQGSVTFVKTWIEYNVKRNGKNGMLVHTRLQINTLRNRNLQFVVGLETRSGTKIKARPNTVSKSVTGNAAFYKKIRPTSNKYRLKDVRIFVPYSDINVRSGKHSLRLHIDLLDLRADNNIHINYHNFSFTRP